jgi:large repetitive protein
MPFQHPIRMAITAGLGVAASIGLAVTPGAARAATSAGPSSADTSITVAGQPGAVVVDQSTNIAYVATTILTTSQSLEAAVYAIDVSTGKLVGTITASGPTYPSSLALDEATGTLYVGSEQDSDIAVIDTATGTVTDTIALPDDEKTFSLAVDPSSNELYAGLGNGDLTNSAVIAVVDPAPGAANPYPITSTITGLHGNTLSALAVSSAGDTLYAGASVAGTSSTIYAIDTATDAVTKSFAGSGPLPMGIAADPANGGLYVDYFGIEARYSLSTYGRTGFYPFYPISVAFLFDPSTGLSYTVGLGSGFTIDQINSASTALNGQISVPSYGAMGLDQATDTLVYAAGDAGDGSTTRVLLIPRSATARVTSAAKTTFTTGKAGSFTAQATGTPSPFFSLAGRLPAGVTFFRTGKLSGTPARGTGGVYRVTITASNGLGAPVSQAFVLTVDQPAAITSANHATFAHGRHGSFTVRTTGYPVTSVTESGRLPAGLRFTAGRNGTATISGTPAASARGRTYIIGLTATNKVGAKATQRFTLKVS